VSSNRCDSNSRKARGDNQHTHTAVSAGPLLVPMHSVRASGHTARLCIVQCSLACSIRLAFLGIQPTTIPVALPWGVVGINGPTCAGIVCMCSLTVTEIIPGFQQLSSLTQQLGPVETNGLKHMHATVSFTHMTL
jgi:hypothetical protein